jgi:WD repeat-containing protein mio
MQAAIRWSPHSTAYHQRFLVLNLVDHNLRLYDVEESKGKTLKYKEVAYHTNLPPCRAYDWSPAEEALVAFGLSSGEANLLRIDTISYGTISFPVKSQRACNSVAFNKLGLLATGLDKVRNDFCLNIWNVNHRLATWDRQKNTGWGGGPKFVEPVRRLSSGENISSIKFFPDQPSLLVTGAASKYVRVYDLRGEIVSFDINPLMRFGADDTLWPTQSLQGILLCSLAQSACITFLSTLGIRTISPLAPSVNR